MIIKVALTLTGALIGVERLFAGQIPRPEHRRPQSQRADWLNLNSTWELEFDFG